MRRLILFSLLVFCLTACTGAFPFRATATITPSPEPSLTPTQVIPTLWISPSIPRTLREKISDSGIYLEVDSKEGADFWIETAGNSKPDSRWVYVLASPFATIPDEVGLSEVKDVWSGGRGITFQGKPILMTSETKSAFQDIWGDPAEGGVKLVSESELVQTAWQDKSWALLPFENLDPQLKVLMVDGKSPLISNFSPGDYPLRVNFSFKANPDKPVELPELNKSQRLPASNFDPSLMTSVLMTGTTALVRSTAERMETKGISYPGEKIGSILRDADFTHVSNEVSFTPNCPKPDPWFINLRFCSNPAYIQLLEEMGVDIVELTGNHLLDYNADAFLYSYSLYQKEGWKTFGGGVDLEAAREPLIVEHHGNRIALIGCNPVGPDFVWATEKSPGAAPCDFESMTAKIKELHDEGILVIATLQDQENYEPMPLPEVKQHLDAFSAAGAAVVSGSQSHFPQGFSFSANGLIHYGLGNLFFDQMDYPVVGTRREFYDKHFFYNGKYISTEVLTGMLEDYAQPRPMTPEERSQFLSDIFTASGW